MATRAGLTRRSLFYGLGGLAGGLALGELGRFDTDGEARLSALFSLGVASGDPGPDGVMLWTRLAPDPLGTGGLRRAVAVRWRVALDPALRRVVSEGEVTASPEDGHSVCVWAGGLPADSWLYYQFTALGQSSRVGRTRTFPREEAQPRRLRFALVSCQCYQEGYFAAYRDIAGQELDFVLHVGDYIYEDAASPEAPRERRHEGREAVSVADYRRRYALYRLDPDLQDAHARFPFITTWDDHEVVDNYAGAVAPDARSAVGFAERRAAAYRVYAEMMPIRARRPTADGSWELFRQLRFGGLAELHVLDTRQFRSDQPCGDGLQRLADCPQIRDPNAAVLGERQERWLLDGLRRSRARWNVLAQQVMMMRWDLGAILGESDLFNVNAWDGYRAAQDRLLRALGSSGAANPIVLSGDIHCAWAAELRSDFSDPRAPTVASEFVCSSVSSVFGDDKVPLVRASLPSNPHVRFFDGLHRGYALCEVTPELWRTDFRAVARPAVPHPFLTVPDPALPVFTLASYGVRAGQPGVVPL